MFEVSERPLGEKEVRRLRRRIASLEGTIRALPRRSLGCLAVLSGICLLVVVIRPGDPFNRWGALALLGVFALVTAWAGLTSARELRAEIKKLEESIREGRVVKYRIVASRCFVVSEADDEGADYYFDVGDQGTVRVSDYEIESGDFPNSDFTVVEFKDANEAPIVTCRGQRLEPIRVVSREEEGDVAEYEPLKAVPVTLEDRLREMGQA
ncbi:MAG: hypothetical protein ACO1SV_14430 [Fimbriimonas sp.]